MIGVAFGVPVVAAPALAGGPVWQSAAGTALILAAWAAFMRLMYFPLVVPALLARQVARLGHLATVIDDAGILETADHAQAFHGWDAVRGHAEDAGGILIEFTGGLSKYVAKRLLTAKQVEELRTRLAARA